MKPMVVEQGLAAEEQQQHEDQVGHAADQRRVGAADVLRQARAGELRPGAEQAEHDAQKDGAKGKRDGHQGAIDDARHIGDNRVHQPESNADAPLR
jgi:hypothetical protein